MSNVIQFPLNEVQSWIDSGEGICSFCRGSKLKANHRDTYDLRCMDCGHEFDMHDGEIALRKEARLADWDSDYDR